MVLHRNSQKRVYIENGVYFITTNTYQVYPYFEEDLLCDLLVDDLLYAQQIKRFDIFAYKINPEHIHLLMRPRGKYNYSEIMNSLKTNFSRNANRVTGANDMPKTWVNDMLKAGARAPAFARISTYRDKFITKHGTDHDTPKFDWQDSFHDHIIRDEDDFRNHVAYIQNQWIKHNLPENKYCFVDEELCGKMLL